MIVAGVDEVGRGPLAGPVVTAAVILKAPILGVKDSKQLTAIKREALAKEIKEKALCYAFGRAEVHEINALNIHYATLLAMKRAIEGLSIVPHKVLIDGLYLPEVSIECEAIVDGDETVPEISAASIIAKVARDEEMIKLSSNFPQYGFDQHKGYATKAHQAALKSHGPCQLHRINFLKRIK